MRLEFAAFSNLGPRETNDDRYLAPAAEYLDASLVAVADGIGGAAGGGDAASIAIQAVAAAGADPDKLDEIFTNAVSQIRELSLREPEKSRMGTTLSLALICDGKIHVAHVGDTRIYHLRGAGLNNLTQDQTEIAELVRRGVFTDAQARRYPRRNVLISALTAAGEYTVFHNRATFEVGDRLLLLSDGVHQRVRRGAVLNASMSSAGVRSFLADLEQRVVVAGPKDNFTAVALELLEI